MSVWEVCDRHLLGEIAPVVEAMSDVVDPGQIMLVGAQCRDLLSWKLGCDAPRRRTNDTDVALALEDWDQFRRIQEKFPALGSTGHRFMIQGRPTDIVPFGKLESPPGWSVHPSGKAELNVHGFADTFARADEVPLALGQRIRIPTPPGYAVLKTHAWLDRSERHEYKDAPDLAIAVYWYADDVDRIFAKQNFWAMELHDFDQTMAAAALLGRDMRNGLSPVEAGVLADRVAVADLDLLAGVFEAGTAGWPRDPLTRRSIADALFAQLAAHSFGSR